MTYLKILAILGLLAAYAYASEDDYQYQLMREQAHGNHL